MTAQNQMLWTNQANLWAEKGRVSGQQLTKIAAQAYRRVRLRAGLAGLVSRLTGRCCRLLSLRRVLSESAVLGSHHGGTQPVLIARIRGSEGRCDDFDASFRPLKEHNRRKWMGVALARLKGKALPPVELAQVGTDYFVLDGHHRISVARAFGQDSIDAEVTVWEVTPVPSATAPSLRLQPA